MSRIKVKPRQIDTYRQTFHFSDGPTYPKQDPRFTKYKFLSSCQNQNITGHHIENIETNQQITHRSNLYAKNQQNRLLQHISTKNIQEKSKVFYAVPHAESRQRKLADLKGSLQVGGVQQFLKDQYDQGNNIYKEKLIATDCSFLHSDYDRPSYQNEFAIYNKGDISRHLKNTYDLGYEGSCREQYCNLINGQNRIFVFEERKNDKKFLKSAKKHS